MGRVLCAACGLHVGENAGGHHKREQVDGDEQRRDDAQDDQQNVRRFLVVLQLD